MKDEIKEILDIIKKVSKAEVNSYNSLIETPPMKWEIFLDYITNLQEKLKEATDLCSKHFVKIQTLKTDIKELQQENERLHNIIKEVREYITKQVHRNQQFYEMDIENILEILDKENNNETI